MSDYWVSKKKYFCKYCDVYIADDAPSRQHHENGMRHKGNVERFVRGIYKAGEKRKKDAEEEKREMARVERSAQAAYAQDAGSGVARASSSSSGPTPVASTSRKLPPPKPSNPYANYSTAQSLGYEDPDLERMKAEAERRRTMGVAGEWEVVETPPAATARAKNEPETAEDSTGTGSMKREAEAPPPEEDERSFKLRKKTWSGLGEVYDPGLIPIKPKAKKEEPKDPIPLLGSPSQTGGALPGAAAAPQANGDVPKATEVPKWTKVQWRKATEPSSESNGVAESSSDVKHKSPAPAPLPLDELPAPPAPAPTKAEPESDPVPVPTIKEEDVKPALTGDNAVASSTGTLFKKRRPAGASGGRGQRQF